MPDLPAFRCSEPGCGKRAERGTLCNEHRADATREHNRADHRWVYGTKLWRELRAAILEREPYCRVPGCASLAVDIDHFDRLVDILERGDDPFDVSQLAPLCKRHHNEKTRWEYNRAARPTWLDDIVNTSRRAARGGDAT